MHHRQSELLINHVCLAEKNCNSLNNVSAEKSTNHLVSLLREVKLINESFILAGVAKQAFWTFHRLQASEMPAKSNDQGKYEHFRRKIKASSHIKPPSTKKISNSPIPLFEIIKHKATYSYIYTQRTRGVKKYIWKVMAALRAHPLIPSVLEAPFPILYSLH